MANIPTATRFFQVGVVDILFLPTIAATNYTPTSAEITAGTNLSSEVDDISGWSYSTTFIETKDAKSRIRPKLSGPVSLDDSSITFNGSSAGPTTDARSVFTLNQSGFILFADAGLGTGKAGEVFPVTVGSIVKVRNLADASFKIRVDFGVTNVPKDVTLP